MTECKACEARHNHKTPDPDPRLTYNIEGAKRRGSSCREDLSWLGQVANPCALALMRWFNILKMGEGRRGYGFVMHHASVFLEKGVQVVQGVGHPPSGKCRSAEAPRTRRGFSAFQI